jgi:hypothetical protein
MKAIMTLIACGALVLSLGCSTGGGWLEGRWTGKIVCLGETSDLTMGFNTAGSLSGASQIRTKGSNADYTVHGGNCRADQGETPAEGGGCNKQRLLECTDDICSLPSDCSARLDQAGKPGNSSCVNGICVPCYENQPWVQLRLELRSTNVQLPAPIFERWRYGDRRLEGTVKTFCVDEALQTPQVMLSKE